MPRYRFASRLARLATGGAFAAINRARELEAAGRDLIHLEIGEPDFDTPEHVKASARAALEAGHTHYTPSQGILPLRQAIAQHASQSRGVQVGPQHVLVAPGCKQLIFSVLMALVQNGDEVLCPDPGYPAYDTDIRFWGGMPVPYPLLEEADFRPDMAALKDLITPRTRLVIINSPQNPTGGMFLRQDLETLAELARQKDFLILSDEIYSSIVYDGAYDSIYSQPGMVDHTILVDGFSKSHAMTGWRLGYAVMPEEICRRVTELFFVSVSCVTTFVQWAGIQALQGPQQEVGAMVAELKRRRDVLVDGLNALPGVRCRKPGGAFYVFPNIQQLGVSAAEAASFLLEEAGVAVLPGSAFGEAGEGYLRISYASTRSKIEQAIERMARALPALKPTGSVA